MYNFTELNIAIESAFGVANVNLKPEFRTKGKRVRSLRTLAKIAGVATKKESEHKQLKSEKAARVANYRAQLEANPEGGIAYDVNEHKLYKRELAFASMAIKAGMIDADDFE